MSFVSARLVVRDTRFVISGANSWQFRTVLQLLNYVDLGDGDKGPKVIHYCFRQQLAQIMGWQDRHELQEPFNLALMELICADDDK